MYDYFFQEEEIIQISLLVKVGHIFLPIEHITNKDTNKVTRSILKKGFWKCVLNNRSFDQV